MTKAETMKDEIKWRGSTYQKESIEGSRVNWFNPVSRHHGSCEIESWKAEKPYDDR